LLGAGVVALVFAFQGVAALPVVVAQFAVNGAMFLFSFQALPGGCPWLKVEPSLRRSGTACPGVPAPCSDADGQFDSAAESLELQGLGLTS